MPNGDFEYYTACPTSIDQINRATGWNDYYTSGVDYFNNCNPFYVTYQLPASGQGFIGGLASDTLRNWSQLAVSDISPLTIGIPYQVSYSASLDNSCGVATNSLGVLFIANGPSSIPYSIFTTTTPEPQVRFANYGIITDTQNWIRLSKTFVADSAYTKIVVGGFFTVGVSASMRLSYYNNVNISPQAYYLIDSVVVKRLKMITPYLPDTALCAGSMFNLYDTVNAPNFFNNGNVFTAQLSNSSGSFTNAITIGTVISTTTSIIQCTIPGNTPTGNGYKIRVVSSNGIAISDTISVGIGNSVSKPSIISNSPVCLGSLFNANAASTTGANFKWTGPASFSATGASINVANTNISNAGDYIATAIFYGCKASDTLQLLINPLPGKPVASSNTPICSGNTLNLISSTSTSGVGFSWTGPNSFTSSAQNPSVINTTTTTASGDYIVTATITATGCSAKDTETVLVRPTPVLNATNNSPVCEGGTVNISATATPTGTISWVGPNSYTSSAQNPTITNANPNASGDYIISVTLNGCTGKDTTTVMVNPQPIIPLTGSNTPVCVGMGLNLAAASNAGASYSWTGPNGFSSAAQNPTRNNIGIADAGTYSVIATLNGCSSVAGSTAVVVNPAPFVTIYSNPADSICQGSPITFVALPANTSTPTYRWTKNSSPSVLGTSNTFISTTINNNDLIRCEITEIQKCGVPFTDTSNEIKMTVLSWVTPSVSITANPPAPLSPNQLISFTATPVNGGSKPQYQWTRNGTNVIGANAAGWSTQQLSNNDVICVSLTSSEKCPQPKMVQSNCITVTVLTDVDNIKTIGNFTLYPNPNNGSFIIKGSINNNETITLQILNATGQLVYEARTLPKNKELYEQVDVQHLPGGLYMLRLNGKDNIRFTIER